MQAKYSKKSVYFFIVMCILLMLYMTPKNVYDRYNSIFKLLEKRTTREEREVRKIKNTEFKYILQWTSPNQIPFSYMGKGQEVFVKQKCPFTNCIVTSNRSYLGDSNYTKFDAIVFALPEVTSFIKLPRKRSLHQKYVFASIESGHNYPICSNRFDGYFNWTWTFRLDSEVRWGYMVIRDKNNVIIGPNKEMHWMKLEDMHPVSEEFKKQFEKKKKAAAWLVSHCFTRSEREHFVESLQKELKTYELNIDIYGKCYDQLCSEYDVEECDRLIKDLYYFYLAFENAFSEDYVTEKVLRALKNNAIPIVYGGANYTRFLPDGIYLNARELGIENLAMKMNELIKDPVKYFEYFKWRNHYSYHDLEESVDTNPYCLFCAILNNHEMVNNITVLKKFRDWWDPPNLC